MNKIIQLFILISIICFIFFIQGCDSGVTIKSDKLTDQNSIASLGKLQVTLEQERKTLEAVYGQIGWIQGIMVFGIVIGILLIVCTTADKWGFGLVIGCSIGLSLAVAMAYKPLWIVYVGIGDVIVASLFFIGFLILNKTALIKTVSYNETLKKLIPAEVLAPVKEEQKIIQGTLISNVISEVKARAKLLE